MALQTICNIDVSNAVCCLANYMFVRIKAGINTTASSLLKSIHKQSVESSGFDFISEKELGLEEELSYWCFSF